MFFIYTIMVILSMYLIFLLLKYSGSEKPEYKLDYFRDKEFIKYPPIIAGYLMKKKVKQEHFIATVLDFVCKGNIKLEKTIDGDWLFTILKNIQASDIEIEALQLFFNDSLKIGVTQTLSQFYIIIKNEKVYGNYGKIKRDFNTKIRNYFDRKEEIKKITRSTNLRNIVICYGLFILFCYILQRLENPKSDTMLLFVCSTGFFILFIATISFLKFYVLGILSSILPIITLLMLLQSLSIFLSLLKLYHVELFLLLLLIIACIIIFDDMLQRKKTNLANAYQMIKGLKQYIIDYSNIKEYGIDKIYLWDEYYVYAVALNINKIYTKTTVNGNT